MAVCSIFAAYAVEELFAELDAMKAGAAASADEDVPGAEEKCPAHTLRIVALIAAVMNTGGLCPAEEEWLVAVREEGDLDWILETLLGEKAMLMDMSLKKDEVEEDIFKTAYVMQINVYKAVFTLLTNDAPTPVAANVSAANDAQSRTRLYINLNYTRCATPDGSGFALPPDAVHSMIYRKLGNLPSEERTKTIAEEESLLSRAEAASSACRWYRNRPIADVDGGEDVDAIDDVPGRMAKGGINV